MTPRRPKAGRPYTAADIHTIYQRLPGGSFGFTDLKAIVVAAGITEGRGPAEITTLAVRRRLLDDGYMRMTGMGDRRVAIFVKVSL